MKTHNKLISIRNFLLTSILGVASFVLIAIVMSVIFIIEAQEKSALEKSTVAWANSLAQASVSYLIDNQKDAKRNLNTKLKSLVTSEHINYVHLYKVKEETATYFTGFNKSIYFPPISNKIDQLDVLSTLKQHSNYIELAVKIEHNKKLVGHLYIQSSTKHITDWINKLTIIAAILILIGLTLFALLAHIIKNRINQPIVTLVESIQEISHRKEYNESIESLPVLELDVLAQNINILLNRTEKHINKKDEKHQQALLQNNTLAEKVKVRTDALKESNQELLSTLEKLHQFQGQLVETEKMASLGDMVAGIAHEVNTPIGLGVTASTLLGDRLNEIKEAFENKSLKSSQLKKFLDQGEENIGIIYRNLERAAKLISSFKKVAVDQSSVENQVFNFKGLLEEVFVTLKAKLNKNNIELTIDCPENLTVESKPGPINQILLNLILNSIIHGFENETEGAINISVMYLSDQIHICYNDDGIGINESIKDKVFEPFTTTKRGSGGSGLGLHLIFNIVTQALNGHIDFESSIGVGTTFNITFPAHLVSE